MVAGNLIAVVNGDVLLIQDGTLQEVRKVVVGISNVQLYGNVSQAFGFITLAAPTIDEL